MSRPFDEDELSSDELQQIDGLCVEFEKCLKAGQRPDLNKYVDAAPPALRSAARHYLERIARELDGGQCRSDSTEFSVTLDAIIGPHCGRRFRFTEHDSFIVGRAPFAHFRLARNDPFFSRVHFLVETNPPACRLVDMGSLNGTQVNGRRVYWVDLREGDLIRAGETVIRVHIQMPAAPAAAPPAAAAPPPRREDFTPESIPGYEIVEQIGCGGLGAVYLARRTEDGAQVDRTKHLLCRRWRCFT